MANTRANSANPGTASVSQAGATQPVTNFAGSTPASVSVTTFPRPGALKVSILNPTFTGAMISAGCATTDTLERDSDGGIWDSTVQIDIPPEATNLGVNDMLSN
jgi:hypothetical protein